MIKRTTQSHIARGATMVELMQDLYIKKDPITELKMRMTDGYIQKKVTQLPTKNMVP